MYDGVWKNMIVVYKMMGLSEEEICNRIVCKTGKALDRGNLGDCDIGDFPNV